MLRAVSKSIQKKTYCPYPTREVEIPKDNGKFRELSLLTLADRTVSKALLTCMDSYWRQRLPGIGRDVWRTYAEMEKEMQRKKAYVLAVDDVRNCYPSIRLDRILECHTKYIQHSDLLWLLTQTICGQEGPDNAVGLSQGSPYNPTAMELTLHTSLDEALEAKHPGCTQLRYVDNLTYVCSSVRESKEILESAGTILGEHGLSLKAEDGPPQDIRDPEHNRSVLGLIPRWEEERKRMSFDIPEPAFESLQKKLLEANEQPKATEVARQKAYGWIGALGPALTEATTTRVINRVLAITRDCCFREIPYHQLIREAQAAQQRWEALRKKVR